VIGTLAAMASFHHISKDTAAVELTEAPHTFSPDSRDDFDKANVQVAEKLRGTTADQRDMAVMGKKQVLRVSIPASIAAVRELIVSSETSALLPCSALRLRV